MMASRRQERVYVVCIKNDIWSDYSIFIEGDSLIDVIHEIVFLLTFHVFCRFDNLLIIVDLT